MSKQAYVGIGKALLLSVAIVSTPALVLRLLVG